jgi:hypothetical protein
MPRRVAWASFLAAVRLLLSFYLLVKQSRDILILTLYARVEHFFYKEGGGVDIHILQVKIGLNLRTCKAEFVRYLQGQRVRGTPKFLKGIIWKRD